MKFVYISLLLCFIGCSAVVETVPDLREEGEFCHPSDDLCEDDLVCRPWCDNSDNTGCSVMDEPRQYICR